jgi:AraC-like DNA-binding protein
MCRPCEFSKVSGVRTGFGGLSPGQPVFGRNRAMRRPTLVGWQIVRVQAFIEKNLDRTIHTGDLSAVARLSPAHFSRSFTRAFGETPHAYVMSRRLEKACYLMMTSTASLSEIALSAGLSD